MIETLKEFLAAVENTGASPDEPLRVAMDDDAEDTATIREIVAGCDGVLIILNTEKRRTQMTTEPTAKQKEWFDEVTRICKERGYAEWFYADRAAWLEDMKEMTPLQAVEYQREYLQ